jgi:hypothetical protein
MITSQFVDRANYGRCVASVLVAISCWCSNSASIAQAPDAAKSDALPAGSSASARTPLEGKVSHDETMPPLGEEYSVGKKFDPSSLSAQTPDNVWIPVPEWFAGKFHSDSQNVVLMYFYKTGRSAPPFVMKEVSDLTSSQQRSKDGQYWQYVKIPRTQVEEIEEGKAYLRAVREDLISESDTKLILKYNYCEIKVNDGGRILSTKQIQSINTYTQLDDDLVMLRSSLKSFDGDGQPVILQHGEKILKRIAPYHEIDESDGQNLKQLFTEYLKKTGHEDLIPVG